MNNINRLRSYFSGVGYAVPKKVLSNADLEKMVETTDEWITTRTGIKERHIAVPGENTSDIGFEAAKKAIAQAGITPMDIDLIIVCTITPDFVFPCTAALIQEKLGAEKAGTIDIEAACTGFIYGASMGMQFIETGRYEHVLVIGAETMSRITDWTDRNTCVLFGDGAGAAVISRSPENNPGHIIDFYLRGAGKYKDMLVVPAGGTARQASVETVQNREHFIKMKGSEIFKLASNSMSTAISELLKKNGMTHDDIDWLIPHQANIRIMKQVAKNIDLAEEKIIINIERYGNTSAATVPLALAEAYEKGQVKRGQKIVGVSFGGGMTWGACLFVF